MSTESSSLLVVDDDEMNRDALARRLQKQGYRVTIAQGGREAVELLGDGRFDLVLLDVMMPGMNGLEVLKLLRRVDSLIDLPVIMVTAKDQSENVVEALELGANDYVTKPLDFPVVLARIRTQLALRQSVARVTELEQKLTGRNQELEGASRELTAANGRMKRDLEAAAQVQRAFLPTAPPEACGARFAWAFRPCAELAGDFLNVFRLDDRRLGLSVLDVKGHGAAAALLSVAVSQFLARVSALPSSVPGLAPPPAEVAAHMSRQFSADPTSGQLLTFLYGILDLDRCSFRFAAAGHPGPVHLPRQGEGTIVEAPGLPVGLGEAAYREHTVPLGPGDRLYLYCEGLTEARNPDGEHFGGRRLVGALERGRALRLAEGLSALVEEVEQWCAAPLQDDVAILAVEVTDPADGGE